MFRQEALRQAERERRKKYKAQNDEREVVRVAIREKVNISIFIHYNESFSRSSIIFLPPSMRMTVRRMRRRMRMEQRRKRTSSLMTQ